ncbi:hypothetical protein IJG21_02585 [Candidatus Saccharibacteria bacterium]|nr:hypothetical protein [Candidatus Saccharibacteria bacterium]
MVQKIPSPLHHHQKTMNRLKVSLRRLFFKLKHEYFTFDNILVLVAIVFCFVWTYGSIVSMSRNWKLSEKIETKKRELALLELEVETLELENDYYRSEEYEELSARAKQNKKLEGEELVYLPENSAEAKAKTYEKEKPKEKDPSNFSKWMSFLFGIKI